MIYIKVHFDRVHPRLNRGEIARIHRKMAHRSIVENSQEFSRFLIDEWRIILEFLVRYNSRYNYIIIYINSTIYEFILDEDRNTSVPVV